MLSEGPFKAPAISYTLKWIIGSTLKARNIQRQTRESRIGCKILNQMADLGMPESYKVEITT